MKFDCKIKPKMIIIETKIKTKIKTKMIIIETKIKPKMIKIKTK